MLAYIKALAYIAFRKLGPEDLPDSRFLLGITLAIYLLLQVPLGWILFDMSINLVQVIAADLLILAFFLWVLLRLSGYSSRYCQTLTAFLGTSALLTVLSIPFTYWRNVTLSQESGIALPSTIIFAIMLWSLVVYGHIISRALSTPFGVGLMVSVGYYFLQRLVLVELLSPVAAS